MNRLVTRLLRRLQLATGPLLDESQLMRSASADVLTPWQFWTLLSVIRHQGRQKWVAKIVRERLRGSGHSLAPGRASSNLQDVPQKGVVPGMIEWEYDLHGMGCCITHRVTGEAIDVNFHDDEGSWIDPFFYIKYLKSLTQPEPIEKRVLELHASPISVLLSIDELRRLKLLEGEPIWRPIHDTRHLEPLNEFVQAWLDPARQVQAAIGVGDWLAAEAFIANRADSLCNKVRQRAAESLGRREQESFGLLRHDTLGYVALQALADMKAPRLSDALHIALHGPQGAVMHQALEILSQNDDESWNEEAWRLFCRLSSSGEGGWGRARVSCAALLLRHNHRKPQIIQSLLDGCRDGEGALLILEHAPANAPMMFHRALRSSDHIGQSVAAAALAILDEPWCHEELMALLATTTDHEATAYARLALAHSSNPACRTALAEWEARFPYEPKPEMSGPLIRRSEGLFRLKMTQLHDRVLPHRGRVK